MDAFTYRELSRMLRSRLGKNLEAITLSPNLAAATFELLRAAEAEGWLRELVVAAQEARPDNRLLREISAELLERAEPVEQLTQSQIAQMSTLSPGLFATQLARLETRICRVEVRSELVANGLLVAPDLVLTAGHGLEDVLRGKASAGTVRMRFDFQASAQGIVSPGIAYPLADDWLVAAGRQGNGDLEQVDVEPGPEAIQVALVRLRGKPGEAPLGGGEFESTAVVRGWTQLSTPSVDLTAGDALLMLFNTPTGPQKVVVGHFSGYSANRTNLIYMAAAEPGSAGAGLYDKDLALVGLQTSTAWSSSPSTPVTCEGISVAAILRWLEAQGLRHLVDDSFRRSRETSPGPTSKGRQPDFSQAAGQRVEQIRSELEETRHQGDVARESALLIDLGSSYQVSGQLERAADSFKEALALAERTSESGGKVRALSMLAELAQDRGESRQAMELLEQAHQAAQASGDQQLIAASLNSLGEARQGLGDLYGARDALQQALAMNEAAFGPQHPNVANSLNSLGSVLQAQGDLMGAREAFERALAISETVFGPQDPIVATLLNNLGLVLYGQDDPAKAKEVFERALAIDEAAFGSQHPSVARDAGNLGLTLQLLGDLAGARGAFERALATDEAIFGPQHPNVASDLSRLGSLLQTLGDLKGARGAFERALAMFELFFPADHPTIQTARRNLGMVSKV